MPIADALPLASATSRARGIIIVVFTLLIAGFAAREALVSITRTANPQFALSVTPGDGFALALAMDRRLVSEGARLDAKQARAESRRALMAEPANPVALRLLALAFDEAKQRKSAKNAMLLAEKLSRRELGAQLWLIEDAVGADNAPSAIRHYDNALSTTRGSAGVLYPILAAALDNEQIRSVFAPLIAADRPWLPSFAQHVIDSGGNPENLARTVIRAQGLPRRDAYRSIESTLLRRLVEEGQFETARNFLRTMPGSETSLSKDFGFSKLTIDSRYVPVSWMPVSGAATGASFSDDGTSVRVFAGATERGVVLKRVLFLRPGAYQIRIEEKIYQGDATSERVWTLRCETPSAVNMWSTDLLRKPKTGVTAANFVIPRDCGAQTLELAIAGGDNQTGLEFDITNLAVVRQ